MAHKRSKELFKEASEVIPGGVNSPVRAFKSVGGTPIFMSYGEGPYIYDEDNKEYIDYIASWGPLIYGHSYAPMVEAVCRKIRQGTSFGTPTEIETQIARKAIEMVPNIDKIRFVNSGTEACMSAIRLARGFTKRDKFIKFEGCYHGHADSFLIKSGSGAATNDKPNSLGVTKNIAKDTLIAQYNDIDSVKNLVETHHEDLAAIIIEPVAGNMGCIPPKKDFLESLRSLCDQYQILLIFDEVMTGFRLGKGGAQEVLGIKADLVTFGKIIGGGLPVGAFAGRDEIMSLLSPQGPVYQAGTLSGNPVAMAAGLTMLESLDTNPHIYKRLLDKTEYLHKGFSNLLKDVDLPHQINRFGSMISVHFTPEEVTDFQSASKGDNKMFKSFFHGMLTEGIYLPPSPYESWFLNDALTYETLDKTIESFGEVIKTL